MKTTVKLMLVVCLLGSIAIADDGNQGNGGRTCGGPNQPVCGGGNFVAPSDDTIDMSDIAVLVKRLFWSRF